MTDHNLLKCWILNRSISGLKKIFLILPEGNLAPVALSRPCHNYRSDFFSAWEKTRQGVLNLVWNNTGRLSAKWVWKLKLKLGVGGQVRRIAATWNLTDIICGQSPISGGKTLISGNVGCLKKKSAAFWRAWGRSCNSAILGKWEEMGLLGQGKLENTCTLWNALHNMGRWPQTMARSKGRHIWRLFVGNPGFEDNSKE